jgi:hypothetical protein
MATKRFWSVLLRPGETDELIPVQLFTRVTNLRNASPNQKVELRSRENFNDGHFDFLIYIYFTRFTQFTHYWKRMIRAFFLLRLRTEKTAWLKMISLYNKCCVSFVSVCITQTFRSGELHKQFSRGLVVRNIEQGMKYMTCWRHSLPHQCNLCISTARANGRRWWDIGGTSCELWLIHLVIFRSMVSIAMSTIVAYLFSLGVFSHNTI